MLFPKDGSVDVITMSSDRLEDDIVLRVAQVAGNPDMIITPLNTGVLSNNPCHLSRFYLVL